MTVCPECEILWDMRKTDGRKVDHESMEVIRIRTVRQLENGETTAPKVAAALGMTRQAVNRWRRAYREGGEQALLARPAPGRKPKLTPEQQWRIGQLVARQPGQLELDFGLWTRDRVRELIQRLFGVKMNRTSVGRLLKRLGMSPQRPKWRAYQQDAEAATRWRTVEFPALQKRALKQGAAIWYGDEASTRTDSHSGTTWAPVGQTPVVRTTGSRASAGMISAINTAGDLVYQILNGRLNAEAFNAFLTHLLDQTDTDIFLVLDNYSVHHSKAVRAFADAQDRLTLCYLPTYSPELNPDEWVWKNVKHDQVARQIHTGAGRKAKAPLEDKARAALEWLKARPHLVRSFFGDPDLAYIHAAETAAAQAAA